MDAPKHIGIIMDGNRRYAKQLLKNPTQGHVVGKDKIEKVIRWCIELGVHELSVYAFSMQNFNRTKMEFEFLMNLFREFAKEFLNRLDEVHEQGIRILFVGRLHLLPDDLQKLMVELMDKTSSNKDFLFNVAVAYGGREELVDAILSIAGSVKDGSLSVSDIDEGVIDDHVYNASQPEMIIRTGGDHRTSNFLLWQSPYSEWFFIDTLWPAFSKEDLEGCINDFLARERRFGR